MNCFYKDYCSLVNTDECNEYCLRYCEMNHLLQKSMIPEKRQYIQELVEPDIDKQSYAFLREYMKNIKQHIDKGRNLVIYSDKTGNGKTSWAIKLLLAYFNSIWAGNGFRTRGYFIYVPDFLNRIKASIKKPDEELEEILANIKKVDLVVMDDIGTTELSEYDMSVLSSIIDQRCLNDRSTIYTTNCDSKKLRQIVGERMFDRIWNTGTVVQLRGNSKRGR